VAPLGALTPQYVQCVICVMSVPPAW
jgi:hypothetical protein